MEERVIEYKEDKQWKKDTYLKKYLVPPMKIYKTILQKSLLKLYPNFENNNKIQERKNNNKK